MRNSYPLLIFGLLAFMSANLAGSTDDLDKDGLRNEVETNTGSYVSPTNTGTNPNVADTDGDSLPDGMEVNLGTHPLDASSKVKRPNIIFILVDDLGYGDVGCFWQNQKSGPQKFATPGLDLMASEGAMLTHHYTASPVCAPARGSLLQGRHQGHCDIRDSQFDKPLPNNHSLPSMLGSAGYHTVHIGKHGLMGNLIPSALTGTGSRNLPAHPLKRGYKRFFGTMTHGAAWEHYPRNGTTAQAAFIYDDYQQITGANLDLYTTDAWTAFAKKSIIEQTQTRPEQPFFIYLAYDAPHALLQYPPTKDYPTGRGINGGIQWAGSPSYTNTSSNNSGNIDSPANQHSSVNSSWPDYAKRHVSMVRRIDDSVADILQTLKDLRIDDNTLVVFTSDNGAHHEGGYNPIYFQSYANLEGTKRDMWEGGIRVPTIAWWPGKLNTPNRLGGIPAISTPGAFWDWMPTFAELARVPAPSICDGESLVPALTGAPFYRKKDYLYFEFYYNDFTPEWTVFPNHRGTPRQQMQGIRIGDFMGVRTGISSASDNFKIYNVVTDPAQAVNLSSSRPDLQQRMKHLGLAARRKGADLSRPYDNTPIPSVSPVAVQNGIACKTYEGYWPWLPEFRDMQPTRSGTVSNVSAEPRSRDKAAGLSFSGYISVPSTGAYTFSTSSDGGVCLWIHDGLVIDNDFNFFPTRTSDLVYLEAGLHPLRLFYRPQGTSPSLELRYAGPGFSMQMVPASSLYSDGGQPTVLNPDSFVISRSDNVLLDVLENDTAGLPLALTGVGMVRYGTSAISSGRVSYIPNPRFIGFDSFTYQASDGLVSRSALINGTVLYDREIWFPLDEGDGTEIRQAGGNASGRLESTAPSLSWVVGRTGRALRFRSTPERVTFQQQVLPTGGAPRTFSCWVRSAAQTPAEKQALFSQGSGGFGQRFTVRLAGVNGSSIQTLRLETEGGIYSGFIRVNDGIWHHVCVSVADRNSDGLIAIDETRMYVDGVHDPGRIDAAGLIMTSAGGAAPTLGGSAHDPGYDFTGDIDDVRFFARDLDTTDVAFLAANPPQSAGYSQGIIITPDDYDGDGFSNDAEAAAGTDPDDSASYPYIRSILAEPSGFRLTWTGVAGRTYRVLESTDLKNWSPASGVVPVVVEASSNQTSVLVPRGSGIARFYRLAIEATPP